MPFLFRKSLYINEILALGTYNSKQEPITRSLQLPYKAYVTAFLQTGLFLDFYSRKIGQFRSTWARIGKENNGGLSF